MQFFPINRLRIFLRGIRCCAESDFIPGMIPKCCDQFGRSNNQLTNSARCRSRSYKKYRRELKNLLGNLQVDLDALNAGAMPAQIQRGFLHPEPYGVPAIDQRGDGQGLKEFRLDIYPDMELSGHGAAQTLSAGPGGQEFAEVGHSVMHSLGVWISRTNRN